MVLSVLYQHTCKSMLGVIMVGRSAAATLAKGFETESMRNGASESPNRLNEAIQAMIVKNGFLRWES